MKFADLATAVYVALHYQLICNFNFLSNFVKKATTIKQIKLICNVFSALQRF